MKTTALEILSYTRAGMKLTGQGQKKEPQWTGTMQSLARVYEEQRRIIVDHEMKRLCR